MSGPALLVCGSLTLDNVVTAGGALLPRTPGGNVVYAALGAALWSDRVGLVSRAGSDFPGDFLTRLEDRGLDLGGIARIDAPHGMNVAFAYRPDGSRVRAFPPELVARIPVAERGRFVDYTTHGPAHRYAVWTGFAPDAGDLPLAWMPGLRGAHLAAMPVQRHLALARRLRAAAPQAQVQVDSPWYDERVPAQDLHSTLLRDIDLLLPSEADLLVWRPEADPLDSAAGLARAAGRRVLVKRGAAGCLLLGTDGAPELTVPAYPVSAVDPTGAGDSFCGGVLAGLQRFGDLRGALIAGTATASFTVEAAGIAGLAAATPAQAHERFDWLDQRTEDHR